ncbi:Hypothetical protein A7982_05319 [Minicystis rosea]|nr:Hypothetical protein A7982_05319 [Minicystis rosea]
MRRAISVAALGMMAGCAGASAAPTSKTTVEAHPEALPVPSVPPALRARVAEIAKPMDENVAAPAPAAPAHPFFEPARPAASALVIPMPGPPKPRSALIRNGFYNPMPGGVFAGYQADTGLDIAGTRLPVYALAAGTLDYSEPGHTLWTGPSDTANCVRFELDTPIPWKGRRITHVYYAHLSKLETLQREGESPRVHVEAGELLGISGIANHSPHLHIGLLLDGEVEQRYWGTFLRADEIRKVMGGYRDGDRL